MGSVLTKVPTISVLPAPQTSLNGEHSKCLPHVKNVTQTYDVTLLNCQLHVVRKGKLTIGSINLVFSDGQSELAWPLSSLRWYGRDSRHFVFESGHRSPYGRSLLFFKCKNPKRVTQSIDERINSILQKSQALNSQNGRDKRSSDVNHGHVHPSLVKLVFHIARGKRCQSESHAFCRSQETTNEAPFFSEESSNGPQSTSVTTVDSTNGIHYSSLQSVSMCDDLPTRPNSHENCGSTQHGIRSNGRYLIAAAAPHSYVNQPNCRFPTSQDAQWLASCDDCNDYVPEPS